MTRQTFAKILTLLNEWYLNFKFITDTEKNRTQINLWYAALKSIPDEVAFQVVQDYCMKNIYPPQSPTHILDHYKNLLITQYSSGDKAFELMHQDYTKNYDGYYIDSLIKDYLKSDRSKQAVAETLKETRSEFIEAWRDSSQLVFYRKKFVELYERNLQKGIQVLISGESPLKIENKV